MKLFATVLINTLLLVLFFQQDLKFTDSADFSGDIVDYQSVAVNHVMGHPFMQRGGLTDFEDYKFAIDKTNPSTWDVPNFYELTNVEFNRNPSYPFFLSTIYTIFGVKPSIVKFIQLILLCFSASLLIVIGNTLHQEKGVLIGLVASWIFCGYTYLFADMIFSECLIAFITMLSILMWLYHVNHRSYWSAIGLGLILGAGLISKGIFYFVILSILVYEIYVFIRKKNWIYLKQSLVWFVVLIGTITPYLYWQNQQSEETVYFVNNGDYVLLTSNNKYTIDGDWHPEGFDDNIYNGKALSGSYTKAVISYYLSNPKSILPGFVYKLSRAYGIPLIGRSFVFVILLNFILLKLSKNLKLMIGLTLPILFSLSVLLFNSSIVENLISQNYLQLTLILSIFLIVIRHLLANKSIRPLLPFIFAAFLVTLGFHGRFRIVLPFMSMFAYLVIFYSLEVLLQAIFKDKHV